MVVLIRNAEKFKNSKLRQTLVTLLRIKGDRSSNSIPIVRIFS